MNTIFSEKAWATVWQYRATFLNGLLNTLESAVVGLAIAMIIGFALGLMAASGKLSDVEAFRKQVYAREEESTTGIGEGIAIPHGKCDAVSRPGLAAMVIKNGVDFDSLDGEPVTLLFLIAAPNTKDNVHLDVLSKLSVMLMDEEFTENLRNASSVEEFLRIIDQADEEKASESTLKSL